MSFARSELINWEWLQREEPENIRTLQNEGELPLWRGLK